MAQLAAVRQRARPALPGAGGGPVRGDICGAPRGGALRPAPPWVFSSLWISLALTSSSVTTRACLRRREEGVPVGRLNNGCRLGAEGIAADSLHRLREGVVGKVVQGEALDRGKVCRGARRGHGTRGRSRSSADARKAKPDGRAGPRGGRGKGGRARKLHAPGVESTPNGGRAHPY